jgi:hypothetical protein
MITYFILWFCAGMLASPLTIVGGLRLWDWVSNTAWYLAWATRRDQEKHRVLMAKVAAAERQRQRGVPGRVAQ